jgi:hypothetical protein
MHSRCILRGVSGVTRPPYLPVDPLGPTGGPPSSDFSFEPKQPPDPPATPVHAVGGWSSGPAKRMFLRSEVHCSHLNQISLPFSPFLRGVRT